MSANTDFHVQGPCVISWKMAEAAGTAYAGLGLTDNEDLIRITSRDHYRTFSRTDQGDMVGEMVFSGTTMTIDMTLVSFDQDEFVKLIHRFRSGASTPASTAGNEGLFASVGGTLYGTSSGVYRPISLKITPSRVGEIIYEFPRVAIVTGPEYIDFGNTVKRVAFSFQTLAPASGTTIVTTSAVST